MTRLGFLGAMNRDVVAAMPAAAILPALAPQVVPLVETAVSDALAGQGAGQLSCHGAAEYLGGSAFNAARVAALLNHRQHRHDLAFFGIAGAIGNAWPHRDALIDWQVDIDGVHASPLPPATCLAMVEPTGRTLLTAIGANRDIAAFLRNERDRLASAIARCDLVHVTSYLDPETPGLIAGLLQSARRLNPALRVSLDPGAAWVVPGGEDFDRLLAETNILHLNNEEFVHLGGPGAAPAILDRMHPAGPLVVARNHFGATIFRNGPDCEELPATPIAGEVRDATGAGDTFCGAFLWHYLAGPDAPLAAARQGFDLARAKIAVDGPMTADMISANRGSA